MLFGSFIVFEEVLICGTMVSGTVKQKIKERIAGMDYWTDKQENRAAVDVLIRNVLYEEIPDSMFDRLAAYRKAIYEHIYTHYKQAA